MRRSQTRFRGCCYRQRVTPGKTLARITTIQRIRTEAGLPPSASECNVSANDKESRSAYSADYYFYAPAQQ